MSNKEVQLPNSIELNTESPIINSDNLKENDLSIQDILKNKNNENEINILNLLNKKEQKNNESKFEELKINDNIQIKAKYQRKPSIYKNIGINFVFSRKYIFGPTNFLWLLILIMISIAVSWSLWLYFLGNLYPTYIYIYCCFYLLATEYFMILCYLTEPGIIPKNHPNFTDSQKREDENKNDIKNKEITPIILTERKCEICNIFQPPGTFHCSECDNCVMEFEDHYHFLSNCIGKRNFKYFLLFLFFGSNLSLNSIFLNLIAIIEVYVINYNKTILYIYKGNKNYFFLSISFILLSFLFILFCINICTISFALIGFGLFIKLWYQYIPTNVKNPSYYNPFISLIFYTATYIGIFVIRNFGERVYFISKRNIIRKNAYNKEKNKNHILTISDELKRRKSVKERIKNLINLFCSKIDKSLIVPERDL